MATQELNGAKVLRTLVNQRSFSLPHRMGAVNR
jgi:hypothetical protein